MVPSIGFLKQLRTSALPSTHTAFGASGIFGAITLRFHRWGNRGTEKSSAFPSRTGPRTQEATLGRHVPFSAAGRNAAALSRDSQFPDARETPWQCLAPTCPQILAPGSLGERSHGSHVSLLWALKADSWSHGSPAGRPLPPISPCWPIPELHPRLAWCNPPEISRDVPTGPRGVILCLIMDTGLFSFSSFYLLLILGVEGEEGHDSNRVGYK